VRLRSRRIVTPLGVIAGEVEVADGAIVAVVERGVTPGACDLGDRWLVPGFIDGHLHGGAGAQCNSSDPDEIAAVARFHAAHGTTSMLATMVAAPVGELVGALRAVSRASSVDGGATVLGAHLEGPFLNPRRPGAMDAGSFVDCSGSVLARLLDAGGVRMMTLAPELPGALPLIAQLAGAGVIASLGHSEASDAVVRRAVSAGARSVTHLFNAMGPLHHRAPGLAGAALDLSALSCELICDGLHVSAPVMRIAVRAAGTARIRLVTDAMAGAGMPDGVYPLGSARVSVRGGRAVVVRRPGPSAGPSARGSGAQAAAEDSLADTLAGSTLTMDAAVAGAVAMLGLGVGAGGGEGSAVAKAVAMASTNPAALLGVGARKGAIAVGMDADLAVLDEDLRAYATVARGRWIYGPSGSSRQYE
jgi:N-acetylglucosamine-6-phosphate deacetylase